MSCRNKQCPYFFVYIYRIYIYIYITLYVDENEKGGHTHIGVGPGGRVVSDCDQIFSVLQSSGFNGGPHMGTVVVVVVVGSAHQGAAEMLAGAGALRYASAVVAVGRRVGEVREDIERVQTQVEG